jgi:hypothetical protein
LHGGDVVVGEPLDRFSRRAADPDAHEDGDDDREQQGTADSDDTVANGQ